MEAGGEDAPSKSKVASERWKILRRALLAAAASRNESSRRAGHLRGLEGGTHSVPAGRASVRRFSTFGLLEVLDLSSSAPRPQDSPEDPSLRRTHPRHTVGGLAWVDREGKWLRYGYHKEREEEEEEVEEEPRSSCVGVEVAVKHIVENPSLEVLMGFNNTGNVCVWPSEELLAYYCLSHLKMFTGASVCELGGGMTCLAGIMLACSQALTEIWLTDGNEASVENIREIVSANSPQFGKTAVSASVLVWNEAFLSSASPHEARYDYIICADCLFFEEVHSELARVMLKLVRPRGTVLVLAPRRSGSLDRFCLTAQEHFTVQVHERYDSVVWAKHEEALRLHHQSGLYTPDLHYPLLLILKRLQ